MLAARRLTLASRLAVAPRVAPRVASSMAAAATRAFATAAGRKRSASAKRTRSSSAKRTASKGRRSAPKAKARTVSPAVARKRAAAQRQREKEAAAALRVKEKKADARERAAQIEADKKDAAKERKAEQRDRKAAKEQEAKEAKAERKAAQRERKAEKKEEEKAVRAAQREVKREKNRFRRERDQDWAREVRDRKKYRTIVKKDRENEELAFKKLRQQAIKSGDPNAPKRALSAWTLFAKEKLPAALAAAQGDFKGKASTAMKALSVEWKALPAETKKPYEDKAAADKARYASESASYDAGLPKQPLSPYLAWSNANRAAIDAKLPADLKGRARVGAFGKASGEQWKALSAEAKAPFEKDFADAKVKFEAAKTKFVNEQLAQLPNDLHEIMRSHIPGRVSEIPAWVGKVQQLLQQEMSATDAAKQAGAGASGSKKKASA